jgi:WD40 repeat protein
VISANGQALVGIGRNEEKEYARVNGEERYFLPGERPKLVVVNLSTGKHLGLLPLDEDDLRGKYYSTAALAAVSHKSWIVLGCRHLKSQDSFPTTLNLWDGSAGRLLHSIADMYAPLTALAIAPDEQIFASGYENGTIKLLRLSTGQLLCAFSGLSGNLGITVRSMVNDLRHGRV